MKERATFNGFFSLLKERIRSPRQDPGYWFYFIVIIIIVGGLGFWVDVFPFDKEGLTQSLNTYFIAILATSTVDISLKEFDSTKAYKKSFQMASYLILVIGIIVFLASESLIFKIIATASSWLTWWIANADNTAILGEAPVLSNVTGDKEKIKGTYKDIKH